jgi:16S rRNA (guanine966-N2)-methyltransferase
MRTRPPKTKLRVTAGTARGTVLSLPDGARPVPSRMKQALFNILRDRVTDAAVLDLFSGTGSLGIEAASRGARTTVLVEVDPRIAAVLEENIRRAHVENRCTVLRADAYLAHDALGRDAGPFDILFLDPPYIHSEDAECRRRLGRTLRELVRKGMLKLEAAVVLHVRAGAFRSEDLPEQVEATDVRRYGAGTLMICCIRKNTCN